MSNIFSPGHLGGAIGKANHKKGLRIIGFRPSVLLPVSPEVTHFYNRIPADFTETLECCNYSVTCIAQLLKENNNIDTSSDKESDFSDTEIYEIDGLFVMPHTQTTEVENTFVSAEANVELSFDISWLESIFF